MSANETLYSPFIRKLSGSSHSKPRATKLFTHIHNCGDDIDVVFTSTLKRTIETSKPFLKKYKVINKKLLDEIYTELEFKAWLEKEEVPAKEVKEEAIKQSKYECITKLKQLESWLTKIKNSSLLALDTETTGLDYMDAKLVGISLSVKSGEAAYIPLGHQQEEQLDVDVVLKKLKPILESTKIKIVGQNIKFDRNILARYGIQLTSFENDTMLMSYVLNSTATRHNLDALAQYYLNYKTTTFEEVAGKGVKQVSFDLVPIDQAVHYASEDADITYRLHEELKSRLAKQPDINTLLEEIEIPLITE